MLLLDNYHLVGYRLVKYERGFDRLELILHQTERDNVFGLHHMCGVGWPNQDIKTAFPEGASWRGHVLVRTLQDI